MPRYLTQLDHFTTIPLPEAEFPPMIPPLMSVTTNDDASVGVFLEQCRENLKAAIIKPYRALDVHRLRSRMMDRLIGALYRHHLGTTFAEYSTALVAVGGYGREEMSLFSDIDLLLLTGKKSFTAVKNGAEALLTGLWDQKLDVGHAVRTPKDCHDIMLGDHTVFTNLMEARLIAGDSRLYDELGKDITTALGKRHRRDEFVADKTRERDERHARFGGSVYLLEPNLKEGKGGLRDLHMLRWIARARGLDGAFKSLSDAGFATLEECDALRFSLRFLLQVRNRLHLIKGKKQDQIQFDVQEPLARGMGFADTQNGLAVEQFMQSYYTIAWQVRQINKAVLTRMATSDTAPRNAGFSATARQRALDANFRVIDGQIAVNSPSAFTADPLLMMTLFQHVQTTGLNAHLDTKEAVARHLGYVDSAFRADSRAGEMFRAMLTEPKGLGLTLRAMHEVHFFEAYLPEFGKLRHRVQHDIYHVYTVDTHSIFAVGELSRLAEGDYDAEFPLYGKLLAGLKRPDMLTLGLLFHDVGKGCGGNHSTVGAEMARQAALRLGYPPEDGDTIAFLVLAHLMMPHLSQRRDIEDKHLIREFAKTVGSVDRLDMLYLLTWADIRAVSAEAWTGWKGELLTRLYVKTRSAFDAEVPSADITGRRLKDVRDAILARLKGVADERELEKFLETISKRYLVSHDDEDIARHFRLIAGHGEREGFLFAERAIPGEASELLILTYTNPRVLALTTGVMLSCGINILDLEVFTLSDGRTFIKLRVQTEARDSLGSAGMTDRVEAHLREVFTGKTRVDELIAKRRRPDYLAPRKPVQRVDARVDIDNDVSPYYTVIDVYAHDRLGLLYDIIRTLSDEGCYVEVSKISTKVEQVVDSFYVKDIFGHKLTAKPKLAEIKNALLTVLTHDSADT